MDGRSPVERAAAAFVPDLRGHCAGRKTKSAVEFFAALGSSKVKQPNRNFHRKISEFWGADGIDSDADVQIARCVRRIFSERCKISKKKLDSELQSCNLRASNSLTRKIQPE